MAIKKVNKDVTQKTEETVTNEDNAKTQEVKNEPKEESLPLSMVQKMISDIEERLTNKFKNQIAKSSSPVELNEDESYMQEMEDDWLDQPVVFFAYSFNFSIHGDKKRGELTTPPHGAVKFKPLIRTKRKKGMQTEVVSVSSVKVQSKAEVDYLRNHSQYNIAFYENMESALNIYSMWAQNMIEAQQSISRLSDMQMIQRAKAEGIAITDKPEAMRRQLVELTAKRAIKQHDRMLYGSLKAAKIDKNTDRAIVEKTIG
jgi:hypothetical protein